MKTSTSMSRQLWIYCSYSILLIPDQALITGTRKRTHKRGKRAASLMLLGRLRGRCVSLLTTAGALMLRKLRLCSPESEYLMISCRPHYLPREFSSIFVIAVYVTQQTDAGTKTALKELYKTISKRENAHP
ncbi:unnamed protein product [Oncorhynchus mykiss]|uniref:Uncharacterized protein n=1 Tax=Oncorhynchus mykiss TaxID=8022 RepID=A0A060YRR6_ONCMY|nr:unnamed protein product [Oncorhynchus mykiss]